MKLSFWATATSAFAAVCAQQTPVTPQQLEIDIVFPRNETYQDLEVFPVVFAIQNITALKGGNFGLKWDFTAFTAPGDRGYVSGAGLYAKGHFNLSEIAASDAASTGPTFLIAPTNATQWLPKVRTTEWYTKFGVQYYLYDRDLEDRCGNSPWVGVLGGQDSRFSLMTALTEWSLDLEGYAKGLEIPECPQFAALIEPKHNATDPECSLMRRVEGAQGNPCAVKIDQAVASSIISEASRLAAPTSTSTTIEASTSTSSAGVGPARTVQTALAAACVLCGLAL